MGSVVRFKKAAKKIKGKRESKRAAFRRLGTARRDKTLVMLDRIGKLASSNYEMTAEEAFAVVGPIREKFAKVELDFVKRLLKLAEG